MARKRVPMRAHTFRCEDPLWDQTEEAADFFNEDISEVLRRALRGYVARYERAKAEGAAPAEPTSGVTVDA